MTTHEEVNYCADAALHCATHLSHFTSSAGNIYTDGMTIAHWLLALLITLTI